MKERHINMAVSCIIKEMSPNWSALSMHRRNTSLKTVCGHSLKAAIQETGYVAFEKNCIVG